MRALQRCCESAASLSVAGQWLRYGAAASGSNVQSIHRCDRQRAVQAIWKLSRRLLHASAGWRNDVAEPTLPVHIRRVMRASAQPVAVITALIDPPEDAPSKQGQAAFAHGATVSSFTCVSLEPPLIAFSLRTPSRMADVLAAGANAAGSLNADTEDEVGHFAEQQASHANVTPHFVINILSKDQQAAAEGFARPGLAPFALPSQWNSSSDPVKGTDGAEHPFGKIDLHASSEAQASSGHLECSPVPVLTNSVGSFSCSLVGQVDLSRFPRSFHAANAQHDTKEESTPTRLFLARVHALDLFSTNASKRTQEPDPLIYWNGIFTTPKR